MNSKSEPTQPKPTEPEPTGIKVKESDSKKATHRADTKRRPPAKRAKTGFWMSKEFYGILTVIITSIVAPIIVNAVNRNITATPTLPPATATASATATVTLPPPTETAAPTMTPTFTPLPTNTPVPTPTATATPRIGADIGDDCIYAGNWTAFPEDPEVTSEAGCLELPSAWGLTLNGGKLSLYPALGTRRGVFGIFTNVPQNAKVTFTFNVKSNSGIDFRVGFFDPQSSPDQNGLYFSRLTSNVYRVIEVKNGIPSNETTDLTIGSTPPYTLTFTVTGNHLTIKGQDLLRNPIVIGGTFQIPNPHRFFIGYRATNANFVSLDAVVNNIEVTAP